MGLADRFRGMLRMHRVLLRRLADPRQTKQAGATGLWIRAMEIARITARVLQRPPEQERSFQSTTHQPARPHRRRAARSALATGHVLGRGDGDHRLRHTVAVAPDLTRELAGRLEQERLGAGHAAERRVFAALSQERAEPAVVLCGLAQVDARGLAAAARGRRERRQPRCHGARTLGRNLHLGAHPAFRLRPRPTQGGHAVGTVCVQRGPLDPLARVVAVGVGALTELFSHAVRALRRDRDGRVHAGAADGGFVPGA
mmetsp:Transcript_7086/g.16573  ORF Transcript_7086/g.16573 Transcript_7086/m.16573 type:complete len:257 (+) Transcript_7086:603-1373(+)